MIIETILFDFDGTLAELRIDFNEMKQRIAEIAEHYLGHHPEPSAMPALEWIDWIAQQFQDGKSALARTFRSQALATIEAMEMEAAVRGKLFAFTRPMLQDLHRRGVKIAVVTRNCARAVWSVFPDVERLGICLIARDHVRRLKPDPNHLHTALQAVGASPFQALMVGDHPLDIETGKRVGVRTAGVASGRVALMDLHACHPDWVAQDCAALVKILDAGHFLPRTSLYGTHCA